MFEAVQFVEQRGAVEPVQTWLGDFSSEAEAVEAAREGREAFRTTASKDYAWWIVRKKGATLADFIADSTSDREFVLDLRSGELIPVE